MAGAGYKLFNTGDVLTAAQVNTYLQEQVVMVFANAAARTTALSGVLAEGMVSYLKDTDALEIYSGAAWVGYGSGDITGVTAGTGISGGGTSGTVTITNSMATEITAAGDIIVGTGSGTFDNLPIGTTGQVLTADTTVSPYKVKWASAASGGGMTLLSTTTLSGSETTISISDTSYRNLQIDIEDWYTNNDSTVSVRMNGITTDPSYSGNGTYIRAYTGENGTISHGGTAMIFTKYDYKSGNNTNGATFTIYNYANTNSWKLTHFLLTGASTNAVNAALTYEGGFVLQDTAAISSFSFRTNQSFSGGSVKIYGVK